MSEQPIDHPSDQGHLEGLATILVAGATGMVGKIALELLLRDDRVRRVVAPTRRPLPTHPKLLNPIVDSATLPHDADWWAVDGAICVIGTTRAKSANAAAYRAIDHDYALAFATLLCAWGTQRFTMVTSMGASARSWFRYTRTKGELEDAVCGLGFPSLTIIRPGFLAGRRNEHRAFEREFGNLLRVAAPILPAAARASPAVTVAALLVEASLTGTKGLHFVTSDEIARVAMEPLSFPAPLGK